MKIAAIIAEYNPFHSGHAFHIQKTRELSGADYIVVIMSPDYVQRGEAALTDKYFRTRLALAGGADLVLELPVCFATGSAEYFAHGAVTLLEHLGCISTLSFGCETPVLSAFEAAAKISLSDHAGIHTVLQAGLRSGMSFPAAHEAALRSAGNNTVFPEGLFDSPNNILALEYIKALKRRDSSMHPLLIRRTGCDYHQTAAEAGSGPDQQYPSAAMLRLAFCHMTGQENSPSPAGSHKSSEESLSENLSENAAQPLFSDLNSLKPLLESGSWYDVKAYDRLLYADLLKYSLRLKTAGGRSDLYSVQDMTPSLADRICNHLFSYETSSQFADLLKTRNITHSRIRRALLHTFLKMRQDDVDSFRDREEHHYVRILGFREEASPLLHTIRKNSSIPVIAKTASAPKLLSEEGSHMFEKDLFASHLYPSLLHSSGIKKVSEYTRSPIVRKNC